MSNKNKHSKRVYKNWNLRLVRASQAMKLLPKHKNGDIKWGMVDVAQIDTGYLQTKALGFKNGKSSFIRVKDGYNFKEIDNRYNSQDPMNYRGKTKNPGHGARVASIICGIPQKGGFPGGVAPKLPLVPYRATNTVILHQAIATKKEINNVANAIYHAINVNGVEVINISLGSPTTSKRHHSRLAEAIDYAYEKGTIVCCAAGQILDGVTYPAKYYRTIGCGGVDSDKTSWNTADQGYKDTDLLYIDVWAPANNITRPIYDHEIQDAIDSKGSGTSYAVAHVTAAAAMWLCKHGDSLDKKYYKPWMRIEAFRLLLKKSSSPLNPGNHDGNVIPLNGSGILNIEKLLKLPLPELEELHKEARQSVNMFW